jgi:hypothetical protein
LRLSHFSSLIFIANNCVQRNSNLILIAKNCTARNCKFELRCRQFFEFQKYGPPRAGFGAKKSSAVILKDKVPQLHVWKTELRSSKFVSTQVFECSCAKKIKDPQIKLWDQVPHQRPIEHVITLDQMGFMDGIVKFFTALFPARDGNKDLRHVRSAVVQKGGNSGTPRYFAEPLQNEKPDDQKLRDTAVLEHGEKPDESQQQPDLFGQREYEKRIADLEFQLGNMLISHKKEREYLEETCGRYRHAQQSNESRIVELQNEILNSMLKCEKSAIDNISLRLYIANTRNPQPVHTDEHYIQAILHLNEMTKCWLASLSKAQKTNDTEMDMYQSISVAAATQNDYGRQFLTAMPNSGFLQSILQNRRRRICLLRQLIWAHLSEAIFHPFCYGLDNDIAQLLSKTVDTICSQGIMISDTRTDYTRGKLCKCSVD